MKIQALKLPGVLLVEPRVFGDTRGQFLETYRRERYAEAGIPCDFVQDNLSVSARDVLRGLHLQNPCGQDKLVSVAAGAVFDVAVDVRAGSPHFGQWVGATLTEENRHQLFIPKGFAHGFAVLSDTAIFTYKCSDRYEPTAELTILWDDPDIGIDWPVETPQISDKDAAGLRLGDVDQARLPSYESAAS